MAESTEVQSINNTHKLESNIQQNPRKKIKDLKSITQMQKPISICLVCTKSIHM
ncbi:hypothetical protein LguiB_026507 [Lonicera macranthoides]